MIVQFSSFSITGFALTTGWFGTARRSMLLTLVLNPLTFPTLFESQVEVCTCSYIWYMPIPFLEPLQTRFLLIFYFLFFLSPTSKITAANYICIWIKCFQRWEEHSKRKVIGFNILSVVTKTNKRKSEPNSFPWCGKDDISSRNKDSIVKESCDWISWKGH